MTMQEQSHYREFRSRAQQARANLRAAGKHYVESKTPVAAPEPEPEPEPVVEEVLEIQGPPRRPGAREIMRQVCEKHGVTLLAIKSDRRQKFLVNARHEIFYRLVMETEMSLPAIGRLCGDRDHTTVLHGYRNHATKHDLEVKDRKAPEMCADKIILLFQKVYPIRKGVSALGYAHHERPIFWALCWHCIERGNGFVGTCEALELTNYHVRNGHNNYVKYLDEGGQPIPIPGRDKSTAEGQG